MSCLLQIGLNIVYLHYCLEVTVMTTLAARILFSMLIEGYLLQTKTILRTKFHCKLFLP